MINKVILLGHVGRDPEIRATSMGVTIANLTLATKTHRDETQWHRCVFFNKQAELVQQYVRKGSLIGVEGFIQYKKYTDKSGAERISTDIVGNNLTLVNRPPELEKGEITNEEDVPF